MLTRHVNFVSQKEYASEVADRLSSLGLYADVDNGENTLPKKIRNGEIAQYNFILGKFFNVGSLSGVTKISSRSRRTRRTGRAVCERTKP